MHELAVTSGFSAAYRLGAKYPFSGDRGCERLFKLYLAASHGKRAVSKQYLPRNDPSDIFSVRRTDEVSSFDPTGLSKFADERIADDRARAA